MSQFMTVDLLWFVLMSILEMLSLGYLLYRWATFIDAKPMVVHYSQFMMVSVLLMLIGTFMLGWNYSGQHHGNWSFDLYHLAATPIEPAIATFIFFTLFYGLAIRIPLFPLHGWLPVSIQQGNLAIAPMFLLGLKVGVFGLLRFVFPIMPESVIEWRELVIVFAVIGIFYAALLAMRQSNLRRLMAYAVISHTGILMIGLFTLTEEGFAGGIMLAINFGLAISGLMVMIGLVWQRTKTASIQKLGGIFQYMPMVSVAFLVSGLAVAGMPGTPGFDAVHLVLESSISEFGGLVTIAAALGNVVAAGFLLFAFQKAFLARASGDTSQWDTRPAQLTERAMAIIMILVILTMGFFSELWLGLFDHSLNHLGATYEQLLGKQGGHE
jgi:NADH-quinone oxidoreductase subunit M